MRPVTSTTACLIGYRWRCGVESRRVAVRPLLEVDVDAVQLARGRFPVSPARRSGRHPAEQHLVLLEDRTYRGRSRPGELFELELVRPRRLHLGRDGDASLQSDGTLRQLH